MNKKKITALLMAAAMALTMVILPPVESVYADSREELEEQKAQAEAEMEKLDEQIAEIQGKKDKALDKKTLLDRRNKALERKIDSVEDEIADTNKRIKKAEKQEQEQYEKFCKQVRQEEERGTITYWSVLFKATDFADLLSRVDFISEIMEHDQQVIADLKLTREKLAADKEELKASKAELDESQKELKSQLAEAQSIVDKYKSSEEGLLEMRRAEEAAAAEAENKLNSFYEDNKEELGGGVDAPATQTGLKGLIWPTNATRLITSPYGNRVSPTLGATTFHAGVDIGAPYGSNVLAALPGKVIDAGWYGGYGLCVIIAHDEGISTLYGHLDSIHVNVGQQVSRGQVIGLCGSSGISTGPHIHYEVRVNGNPINPLPYLPGYIPYDW